MKKLIFLFALACSIFSCQKTGTLDELPAPSPAIEDQPVTDRSCSLEITPLSGSGTFWFATIYDGGSVVARICGTGYSNVNYTKVPWNTVFTVPGGGTYKKYRIVQENLNTTFNIHSDAGCFDITCNGNTITPFYAGCNTSNVFMTIKLNSTTNSSNWLAEVRRKTADCEDELITTIGGGSSGADLFIPVGGTLSLGVNGFKEVTIKQITGNANYTLGAPSSTWAPLTPATFTVNAGASTARLLGSN